MCRPPFRKTPMNRHQIAQYIRTNLTDDDLLEIVLGKPEPAKRKPKRTPSRVTSNVDTEALVLAELNGGGRSSSEIAQATGAKKSAVARTIKKLKDDGKIFQGGERRFARYGLTQKTADDASLAARNG